MSQPFPSAPAPDAAVIPTGRRNARKGLIASAVVIGFGAAGFLVAFTGPDAGAPNAIAAGGTWFLIFGGFGFLTLRTVWQGRNVSVAVDGTGLWFSNGKDQNVIPWHTLAGVSLYFSRFGRGGKMYSLELCPNSPIDRDDPVLWPLVRDEEPLHPHLPRLRYRLAFASGSHASPVTAAVRHYVPQLWLGESERKPGHVGKPDAKGHKERTRHS